MATQGCQCGYLGDPMHECRCTPLQVQRYRNRLSGPLRDRIDLIVEVPALPVSALTDGPAGESSATIRERVVAARARQAFRFDSGTVRVNAELSGRALRHHCSLDTNGARLLEADIADDSRDFPSLAIRPQDRVHVDIRHAAPKLQV
ncbi:MAG: ATP-binding protein [Acidobacteria bacterium]|nr:ATP-binding protein [Acidobacteriota bacterium]